VSGPPERNVASLGAPLGADACFWHLVGVLNSGMLCPHGRRGRSDRAVRHYAFDAIVHVGPDRSGGGAERTLRPRVAGGHDRRRHCLARPHHNEVPTATGLRRSAVTRPRGPFVDRRECQHVAKLGKVEDQIIEHFHRGGGVPSEKYEELWAGADSYDLDAIDEMAVDHVLSLLPGVTERLAEGIDVADVGCGWGAQLNLLARRFPASRFVGFELYEASALRTARRVADHHGLTNVQFQQQDATTLVGADKFDLVLTFDAIHDQARPDLALRGIARSLKPGGVYVGVDISGSSTLANNLDDPLDVFKYTWSVMYCMTVSLAYSGMGLGTVWGEELARKMMTEAGFSDVRTVHLPGNLINCYHLGSLAQN
jgi:ubiquinone/menaquinone biosynthesis C-methylase UbiE